MEKHKIKKPIVSKSELVAGIRKALKEIKLPEEIKLNVCSTITDPAKFFESHLAIVEAQEGRSMKPYSDRLKVACSLVGIDLVQMAKNLKK
jgi:Domain of unknown function (DUF6965)